MLRFLHAVQDVPADGDPVALAIVVAVMLTFSLWALIRRKKKKIKTTAPAKPLPEAQKTAAPGTAGSVKTLWCTTQDLRYTYGHRRKQTWQASERAAFHLH